MNADGDGPAATAGMRVPGRWALDDDDDVVVELCSIGESVNRRRRGSMEEVSLKGCG